jgi:protein LTV1
VESLDEVDHEALAATKARLEASLAAEELQGGEHKEMEEVVVGRGQRWDCESVLSLRSNISNHPSRIIEPQKRAGNKGGGVIVMSEKTGAPKLLPPGAGARGLFGLGGPAAIAEEGEGDDDDDSAASSSTAGPEGTIGGATVIITERRKGETAEEKKARKASVKEARKASRAAKKELKGLFKQEAGRQKRQAAGRAAAGGGVGLGSSTFVIA